MHTNGCALLETGYFSDEVDVVSIGASGSLGMFSAGVINHIHPKYHPWKTQYLAINFHHTGHY
jgi:hypothetical protein